MAVLAFDSSCLSAFGRAACVTTLEVLSARHRRVATPAVMEEIERGVGAYPSLVEVRDAPWLERVRTDSLPVLVAFAEYKRRLGDGAKDIGEATTLAWAELNGAVAIVDDLAARNVAKSRPVTVRGSLWLIATGLAEAVLDEERASQLIDALRLHGARLPCRGADFVPWCRANNLL